ncbi:MAG: Type 1 glutamine amidotransferase-like domain-containing protein, partial [Actinomycetota bacterium]
MSGGRVCLQGGAEFSPACRPMDATLLAEAGGGPVAVTALAAAPGRPYTVATGNGVRHFRALGAGDVRALPDARTDPAGAVAAAEGVRLLVVPGGSPVRLHAALRTTPVGRLVRQVAGTGLVLGASAGAMLLCSWTLLPGEGDTGPPAVAEGLGVVPGALVLPHFTGDLRWYAAARGQVPDDVVALGIPEGSGALLVGGELRALGTAPTLLLAADGSRRRVPPGGTVGWPWPGVSGLGVRGPAGRGGPGRGAAPERG